ncbi:putative ribonuclease H-like domain-containing protein [Tanacetum coccineum]
MGLESLEARIVVHEKNEVVYEENIAFLKYDVQVKDISIKELKNQLENALKEKDDLKLKLENFEESSKNLTKLINSQIRAKDKTSLGYDGQMNESEVVHSVFNNRDSDVDDNPVNDIFKTGEGFHAVPPPYTGNYMPSRPDLSFAGLDEYVLSLQVRKTKHEEWGTDNDNDNVFRPISDQTKPKFTKINFVKSGSGIFDSGYSRHMTGNKSYLSDYQEIDGGFVAFVGSPKGGQLLERRKFFGPQYVTGLKNHVLISRFSRSKDSEDEFLLIESWKEEWNQTNRNASIKDNVDAIHTQQYILLPFFPDSPHSSKDAVADDAGKNTTEEPTNEGERNGQEKEGGASNKEGYANSTNRVSTISPSVSVAGQSCINIDDLSTDPLMSDLEDTTDLLNPGIFSGAYDNEDVGAEADLNNLETTMNVSPIPITRIHKDHPKDQIIRDINSATQTRRMPKIYEEHTLKVWTLVDLPNGKRAIGTKWVFRNKKDERGIIARNKERLVAQGYTQEEGIDYDKMDVKSAFLYGIHQAPRAWYETLSTYLLENGFRRGTIDKTLFIKKDKGDILLVQVYVDDIIFGSTKKSLCVEFEQIMHKRFQMSSMRELTFFLGLQIMIGSLMYLTASRPDIMFTLCACARDSPFNLEAFSNSDYAGASLDRKSTTGGCQFLSKRLISWQCKKQTIVANSTTKAEYVAATNCCGQVLWIQNQMLDYGFNFMNTKIHIDNESTICIVKNPVFHSKTKHIEIRHHFIRDSYEKRLIQVIKIHTDHNVADLLTKAFDVSSDEFGVKTGSCKVNAARQDLVLLGEISYYYRTCNIKQKCVKSQTPRQAKRGRDTKIPQSGGPPKKVGDEAVHKELGDRMERAAYTTSS